MATQAPFKMTVTLVHRPSQQATIRHFTSAESTTFAVPIDAEHLAGLQPNGAAIQPFDVMIDTSFGEQGQAGATNMRTEFWVVLDREARMPANVPLGKVPFIGGLLPGQAAVEDTEELAQLVIKEWEGTDLCVTSQVRTAEELTPARRLWEPIPSGTTLREFVVHGTFPKRIVLGNTTAENGETTIATPKGLRFVIAQSKPSRLVSLLAAREGDMPERPASGCQ
ncbi:hypothetical protein D3C72_837340 [compost metagenome]